MNAIFNAFHVIKVQISTLFQGIAPKLEFSTKTTIIECSADAEVNVYPNVPMVNIILRGSKCMQITYNESNCVISEKTALRGTFIYYSTAQGCRTKVKL